MQKNLKNLYKSSLYRNAFFLVINSTIMSGLGFFFWTLATRLFNSYEVGLALTLITSMTLIGSISLFGFDDALIRYLGTSKVKNLKINSIFSICALISFIISVVFVIVAIGFIPQISFISKNLLLALSFIASCVVWTQFILSDSLFVALRDTKYVFIKNSLFSFIKLMLPFLLLSLGFLGIFYSWTAAALVSIMILLLILPKNFNYKPKVDINLNVLKEMFRFSVSNYIMKVFISAPSLILPLIITRMLSPEKTAYFYIAWMIADFIAVVPNSLALSLFAEGSSNQSSKVAIKRTLKISYIILMIVIITIFLLGGFVLSLFGQEYFQNSLNLMLILSLAAIPLTLNTTYITVSRLRKDTRKLIFIGIYHFVFFLSLSLLLIRTFDIFGIGIAWLTTNLLLSIYILLRREKWIY
ncbi:lipopolysaccharide biosynthesis protein [Candidatus Woesearchaeota archaeon]|nr:lipopolysaccharide biosynthesis protein [Candidatus Woesearchaeota archaeon]